MCDYSLMALKNRLATDGEELIVHKFEAYSMGFAGAEEVLRLKALQQGQDQNWMARIKRFLIPARDCECTAVCIPPGARLVVRDIPEKLKRELHLERNEQEVIFTQISAVGFRDAIRFSNGVELLIQRLKEGQRVKVVSVGCEETVLPFTEDSHAWLS